VGRELVVEGEVEGIWGVVGEAGLLDDVLDHISAHGRFRMRRVWIWGREEEDVKINWRFGSCGTRSS